MNNKQEFIKNKIIQFLKDNYLIIGYVILTIFYELLGVSVTFHKFWIRDPRILFLYVGIVTTVLFLIRNQLVRYIGSSIMLLFTGILNILFIVVYEMTGTIFDYSMLKLRNDAMGIIESLPINFIFFSIYSITYALYLVFGFKFIKKFPLKKTGNIIVALKSVVLIVLFLLNFFIIQSLDKKENDINEVDRLYGTKEEGYTQLGISSTVFNAFYKGWFYSDIELGDSKDVEDFIYSSISKNTKEANPNNIDRSNYNVITILAETLEWFSFMQDENNYPNGFHFQDPNILSKELYPNLYRLYNESIVMDNFHSREKTDISENLSIIGSYPTNVYINYDYPNNTNPMTVPNVLKTLDPSILCKSYHNGERNYYNRNVSHLSLGFEEFIDAETMEEKYNMPNWIPKSERNLDKDMIDKCKEDMFPTDRRFYTYITTITMHGQFLHREGLEERGYYDIMDSFGFKEVEETNEDNVNQNLFRNYAVAAMEFDRAIGAIFDYLEETNLLEKTIIVVFGDHNAYYQGLSSYVKQITKPDHENYTNLYRVPLMIYVPNMEHQVIHKFCCTADIVPTIYDLLGINYFDNMYFGHSVFSQEESVLYSRAYDIFMTDNAYFANLNKIYYLRDGYGDDYMKDVEKRSVELLNKLGMTNRIFFNDFFGMTQLDSHQQLIKPFLATYQQKLREINQTNN